MNDTDYITKHKKIKEAIEQIHDETNSTAIVITSLAKHLHMDVRTLNKHLRTMEIDGIGKIRCNKRRVPTIFVLNYE